LGALIEVVDDLGDQELAPDAGVAFGAIDRLRGLEMGYVGGLGRGDGAVNSLAEQFGVAVVKDQLCGQGNDCGSRLP